MPYSETGGPSNTRDSLDMLHRNLIGMPEMKDIRREWNKLPKHVAESKCRKVAVLDGMVNCLIWNVRLKFALK